MKSRSQESCAPGRPRTFALRSRERHCERRREMKEAEARTTVLAFASLYIAINSTIGDTVIVT